MAEAIPTERYAWRADIDARSVSEIFVHIAGGNFMLLERAGISARLELYGSLPSNGPECLSAMSRKNDDMEQIVGGDRPFETLAGRGSP